MGKVDLIDLDSRTVEEIVRRASARQLVNRFNRCGYHVKSDGSLVTDADIGMDRDLREELQSRWPDIGFLSEEMDKASQETLLADPESSLWCLDPLDGTSNFTAGVPFFSVSIALLKGGSRQLGLVFDPLRDECFRADRGHGAWLNGEQLECPRFDQPLRHCVALVDFKRLSSTLAKRLVETPPYNSQRNFGSCALEWGWLAAGRGHVYLHGGQKLWDFAAGTLILEEAGGYSCTLDGEPVYRPTLKPRPVIASPDQTLFQSWKDWIMSS